MTLTICQVDAFTERAFAGNPAGVCLLDSPHDERWMRLVAAEMNLSETAFLLRRPDGWGLRWFTPTTEVKLCGHATLASAHTLWETGLAPAEEAIRFHTTSGVLTAGRRQGWIELDFPAQPVELVEPMPVQVETILHEKPLHVCQGGWMRLARLASAESVRRLVPDLVALKATLGSRIVTAPSDTPEYDFVSRFFAPVVGIDEDPVTGAAHCCLAHYWSGLLGQRELAGYQASARGGVVRVELCGDRVKLRGQAVTVLRGELVGPAADHTGTAGGTAP